MGYENKVLPSELSFFIQFNWDNKKIWALDLRVETVAIEELAWHLELPFWSTVPREPLFNLRPCEVLANPEAHAVHWRRIQNADTKFPLHIFFTDRWVIMDGIHRLAKLVLDGASELKIRRVPESALPLFVIPDKASPLKNK